jgi:hypothetical protein
LYAINYLNEIEGNGKKEIWSPGWGLIIRTYQKVEVLLVVIDFNSILINYGSILISRYTIDSTRTLFMDTTLIIFKFVKKYLNVEYSNNEINFDDVKKFKIRKFGCQNVFQVDCNYDVKFEEFGVDKRYYYCYNGRICKSDDKFQRGMHLIRYKGRILGGKRVAKFDNVEVETDIYFVNNEGYLCRKKIMYWGMILIRVR